MVEALGEINHRENGSVTILIKKIKGEGRK
jgi:hypothetical protein